MIHKEITECTNINNIVDEVKQRWRWLGHVFHMDKNDLPHTTVKWTPPKKKRRGRPLVAWKTVDKDTTMAGKNWIELGWLAHDRASRMEKICWRLMLQWERKGYLTV